MQANAAHSKELSVLDLSSRQFPLRRDGDADPGFLFVSPRLINYRDRPQETLTSTKDILVRANGPNAWTYQIGADQLADTSNDEKLKAELLQRIQAISGNVQIDRYREQKDASGQVTQYRVWAHR